MKMKIKHLIIILLYNNQDKITKDITLLFAKNNFDLVPDKHNLDQII